MTTLERAKRLLQIPPDDTSQDDIVVYLMASSQAIEKFCKRAFRKSIYTETVSGSGSMHLVLREFPIHDVLNVKIGEQEITDYRIIPEGMLFRAAGWPKGSYNVHVQYEAGYVLPGDETPENPRTLPETLEIACVMYAQALMREPGVSAERVGDLSVTYANEGEGLPFAVKALITPYIGRWV
ncbi:phage gp6-like head-tail connector protein [Paenibacillus sp. 32352]|uniref:phage gp6-like head-tail connector protein n=1 Tax=Paenibacillus sp. 32352 TaxID=1969111 RepID=UPI002118588D|nr:phage gp6-like head-tail connector protein [Paenibacillus sp. 32352]